MGRPIRNLTFNPTGNIVSGLAMPNHPVEVYREDVATKRTKFAKVGQGVSNANGLFSVSCTGLSVATHGLRVSFPGADQQSELLTAAVTVAS